MVQVFSEERLKAALASFEELTITGPESGDRFFEDTRFFPGNPVGGIIDRPLERFIWYEEILRRMKSFDEAKYRLIHKGTPFYFLFWTAFQLRDYERAVFYVDAALSEDERKTTSGAFDEWIRQPAGQFLTLAEGNQAAPDLMKQLRLLVQEQFNRFNTISGLKSLSVEEFVQKFVKILVPDKRQRSIVTAFYSFILEFDDRRQLLELRSFDGGTIEPFLTHLFKGGLILESLLKQLYPIRTLGGLRKVGFTSDFCEFETEADSLQKILSDAAVNNIEAAFSTTARIRNTSGHSLVWDDAFKDVKNYRTLFEQEINALFHVVVKKYLR